MLSRHADSCFWLGRYVERVESISRLLDVQYHYALEAGEWDARTIYRGMVTISGETSAFRAQHGEGNESDRSIIDFFCFDRSNPSSIINSLGMARENARIVREQISTEMWETINRAYLKFQEADLDAVLVSPHEFFLQVRDGAAQFRGVVERTWMEGEPRWFLDTGCSVERAGQTSRILDVKYHILLPKAVAAGQSQVQSQGELPEPDAVGGAIDIHGWIAVLKSVGGLQGFRRCYPASTSVADIVDFLVFHPSFPSSVQYSLNQADSSLEAIRQATGASPNNEASALIREWQHRMSGRRGADIVLTGLHEFLEDVTQGMDDISSAIWRTYLRF